MTSSAAAAPSRPPHLAALSLALAALLAGGCPKDDDETTDASASTGTSTTDASTTGASTTDASTTGDATTDGSTTGAPDACALLAGKTFKSVDELECGLGPNGVELCRWTLTFTDATYQHMYSDVGETGTYTCAGGVIMGKASGLDEDRAGTIDGATGALVWQTIAYEPG